MHAAGQRILRQLIQTVTARFCPNASARQRRDRKNRSTLRKSPDVRARYVQELPISAKHQSTLEWSIYRKPHGTQMRTWNRDRGKSSVFSRKDFQSPYSTGGRCLGFYTGGFGESSPGKIPILRFKKSPRPRN